MLVDRCGSPTVSVIVPAYTSERTISGCLDALASQDTEPAYEVIVVESSGDKTAEIVGERFPRVSLIRSVTRLLSGAARNLGAESAYGELLLFIDSDCIAEPGWIDKMWTAHQEFHGAAVGGSVINGNPESPASVASYITEFSDFFPRGGARRMNYLASCNLSYRAEVFRRYGGFDPDQPLYVDLMFNRRLHEAGERLLFRPDIKVAHRHRAELREYLAHEARRGRAAVVARRKGLLVGKWWVAHPPMALLAAPALFARKASVFPYRFARAYPESPGRLIRALPYVWLGLISWHLGFIREALLRK